jgi:hypothetical protein
MLPPSGRHQELIPPHSNMFSTEFYNILWCFLDENFADVKNDLKMIVATGNTKGEVSLYH